MMKTKMTTSMKRMKTKRPRTKRATMKFSMMIKTEWLASSPSAKAFKKTVRQLKTFHKEISQTSAKKPVNPINKFKLGLINETLEKANFVLGDEFLPFPGFKTFDEANMPTASDVVLMLSHFIDGLNALRDKYVVDGRWNVTGDENVNEEFDD